MVNALLYTLWGAGIVVGLLAITSYASTSAKVQPPLHQWPEHTLVERSLDGPTLVLALHPRCVCSRATMEELGRLLTRVTISPRIEILVYTPENASDSWRETGVVVRARSLPGVILRPDPKGRESERFKLSVSGQIALFASDGRLMFTGGITPARGHEGDNAGRDALVTLLARHQPALSSTPVFGCSLRREL